MQIAYTAICKNKYVLIQMNHHNDFYYTTYNNLTTTDILLIQTYTLMAKQLFFNLYI
jgi:hypothetical protein